MLTIRPCDLTTLELLENCYDTETRLQFSSRIVKEADGGGRNDDEPEID